MTLPSKVYDTLKFISLIVLPLIATLYGALAVIWGLPHPTEVVGTITAVDTAIGGLLRVSSSNYTPPEDEEGGLLTVNGYDENGMPNLGLTIRQHPDEMLQNGSVKLRVEDGDNSLNTQ